MKKYITISLIVFWTVIVAVVSAGFVANKQQNSPSFINTNTGTTQSNNTNNTNNNTNTANTTTLALSKAELVKHDSSQSCWLLISGKIYDVTTFLNSHPGNASTILPTCGTDATVAYNTKGRPNGRPHSSNAEAMLADYLLGNLNQNIAR